MKKFSILLLVLASFACAGDKSALDELKRFCDKDAGLVINKTVQAKGYYDDYNNCHHCWKFIMNSNYEFIEFCDDKPQNWYAINEPGCWRVTRVNRSGAQCDARIEKEIDKFKSSPTYKDYISEFCFIKRKLSKPDARYGTFTDTNTWDMDNKWKSKIFQFVTEVRDLKDNRILAKETYYAVHPKPDNVPIPSVVRRCSYFEGGYNQRNILIREVVAP